MMRITKATLLLQLGRPLASEKKPMDSEVVAKPQKKIEYRPATGGIIHTYCNNVQLASTSFDVRLMLGEVSEVSDDKVIVEQRVQVAMTWIEAKTIADFLRANVEEYEKLNGPLTMPKNLDKIIVPETFLGAK
jgi:hypothetical protein